MVRPQHVSVSPLDILLTNSSTTQILLKAKEDFYMEGVCHSIMLNLSGIEITLKSSISITNPLYRFLSPVFLWS